jgi:hypothetical protein
MIRSSVSVVCIAVEQIKQDLVGTKGSGICSMMQMKRQNDTIGVDQDQENPTHVFESDHSPHR